MKAEDGYLSIAFIVWGLIKLIVKIAILVWLYKIGYLFHYLIFLVVLGIVLFLVSMFTNNEEKSVSETQNDNIDKEAKKIEIEINNEKIIQIDSSEALKVVENLSVEDKTFDNAETIPSKK